MVFEWHLSWRRCLERRHFSFMNLLSRSFLSCWWQERLAISPFGREPNWHGGLSDGSTDSVWYLWSFLRKNITDCTSRCWEDFIGFGSLFCPYLLFKLYVGGTPLPNTFYAKQAEYVECKKSCVDPSWPDVFSIIGWPRAAIFPGVMIWSYYSIKQRHGGNLSAILWCAGYLFLYISRLPVYQNGRYITPWCRFLFGLLSIINIRKDISQARQKWRYLTFWNLNDINVFTSFVIIGANRYANDVANIESEMVKTAKWVNEICPYRRWLSMILALWVTLITMNL